MQILSSLWNWWMVESVIIRMVNEMMVIGKHTHSEGYAIESHDNDDGETSLYSAAGLR